MSEQTQVNDTETENRGENFVKSVHVAVMHVICDAMNFPRAISPHVLGQDMRLLGNKITSAVLAVLVEPPELVIESQECTCRCGAIQPFPNEPGTLWLDNCDAVWQVNTKGVLVCLASPLLHPGSEWAPFRQLALKDEN